MRDRSSLVLFIIVLAVISVFVFNPKFTGFVSIFFAPENLSVSDSSAVIMWQTDIDSNSAINYGTTEELGIFEAREAFEIDHIVLIANLSQNSTYFFNITSCDYEGNCTTAGIFNFTTSFLQETASEINQTNTSEAVSSGFLDETLQNQTENESFNLTNNTSIENISININLPEPKEIAVAQDINITNEAKNEITNVTVKKAKAALKPHKKVDKKVTDKLAVNDEIPVIVILENAVQDEVISYVENAFGKEDFKLKHRHKIANSFAGNITSNALAQLADIPGVKQIIFDQTYRILLNDSIPLINADDVWNITVNGRNITGEGFTICIADTGIDYTHPDLGNCTNSTFLSGNCSKVLGGYDPVNNDNNPYDDHSHGTHVAGIAAGNGALKGVAKNATIVAVKVCDAGGSCATSDIEAGFEWCIQNRAQFNISVITMSVGGGLYNNATVCEAQEGGGMTTIINNATSKGMFVSIASGNSYSDSYISWPACIRNATSVGSTTKSDAISDFSNIGALLDILAPGSDICSSKASVVGGSTCFDSGHISYSGTSMATPHIAGAAVLIQQYYKQLNSLNMTPSEVVNIMQTSGETIATSRSSLNFSRIDVLAAVNLLLRINFTENSTSNTNGKIRFFNGTDFENAATCIQILPNLVSVDSANCQNFNKSADITINNLSFQKGPRILRNSETCPSSVCSAISYDGQNFTFNVTSFTNYSSGPNANLTIWDDTDLVQKSPGEQVYFFANYTNSSSGEAISTGACTINATNITDSMFFNSTTQIYQFNRSYSSPSIYIWDANCSEANFEPLNASDTVGIGSPDCGAILNSSTTLSSDITVCPGNGININNDSIVLDCNGHLISGGDLGSGINVSGHSNITLKNCTIQDFSYGILIRDSSNVSADNVTFSGNNNSGVFTFNSNNTLISNSTFILNNNSIIMNNSFGNRILNNIFLSTYRRGVLSYNASDEEYSGNVFNDTGWNVTLAENSGFVSVFLQGSNITFNNNTVKKTKIISGVLINASSSAIENNEIYELANYTDGAGTAYGIKIYSNNSIFSNNILNRTDLCTVQYFDSDNVTFEGNSIFSTVSGACISRLKNSVFIGNNYSYNLWHLTISNSTNIEVYENSFVSDNFGAIRLGAYSYNVSVFDNHFVNYSDKSVAKFNGCGVNVGDANHTRIFNNNFTGRNSIGAAVCISSTNADNFGTAVYNNTIVNGSTAVYGSWFDYGVEIYGNIMIGNYYGIYFDTYSRFVNVYNNLIRDTAGYVFYDQISADIQYYNNTIINATYGYYSINDYPMTFANNTVRDSAVGISVDNIYAEGNSIFNNTILGIAISEGGTIRNSNISKNGEGVYGGVYIEGGYSLFLINNTIYDNNGSGIYFNNSIGSLVGGGNISGNRIYNNEMHGILVEQIPFDSMIIGDNTIFGNKKSGIHSNASSFSYNTISRNSLFNNSENGMEFLADLHNVFVVDNNITSNWKSGIIVSVNSSADNEISSNTISGNGINGSAGIILVNATGINITGNNITSNYLDGIFALSSSASITNNIISYNNRSGIYSIDSVLNSISSLRTANTLAGNLLDKIEILWFVQAKTYNGTQLVSGATVDIFARGNSTPLAETATNSSGITDIYNITQHILTNSDVLINFTPHNFTANYSILIANKTVTVSSSRIESRSNPVILNFVEGPSGGSVSLTPTEAYDDYTLTAAVSGFSGTNLSYNYNFIKNGNSLAVLNLPFDFFATDTSSMSQGVMLANISYNATAGKVGGAYLFNGTGGSRITVINNNYLNLNEGTIEAWISPRGLPSLFGNIAVKAGNYRLAIRAFNSTNSNISFIHTNSTGLGVQFHTDAVITKNNWSHVAVTFSNTTKVVRFYLNGQFIKNVTIESISYGTTNLTIGNAFNGTIDELQIYTYVLSDSQIAAHSNLEYNKIVPAETSIGDDWKVEVIPISASGLAGDAVTSNIVEILNWPSTSGGGGGGGGASGVFVAKPTVSEEEAEAREAEESARRGVEVINTTPREAEEKPISEMPAVIEWEMKKKSYLPLIIFIILIVILVISVYSYLRYKKKGRP